MMEDFQKMTQEYVNGIKSMCDPLYVVLYGSSCKGTIKSDMDMFTIVKDSSQELIDAVADFTIDFHRKYGLKEDYDVPYQSKTLYTYNDLEMAISAVSFIHKYDTFLIPPIVMRPDFLGSKEMKYRLLLNALTSNHKVLLGDDEGDIKDMEKKSWETILRIILSQNGETMLSVDEIYNKMVKSEDGSDGKGYLGYMEKNRSDMTQKISIFLDVFQKEGKIKKSDQGYSADKDWMDDLIVKNMKAKEDITTNEVPHENNRKIDFATNKNPLGPLSKDFSNELMDEIKEYPDYSNSRIDQELSDFLGVEKECVSVCQGSLDAIYNIPKCISFNDCVIVEPTYRGYAAAIENMGKKYTKFSMDKDFGLDVEKLSESIKDNTLVFLCNPNNPTGTYVSHNIICELIKKHPKAHFIIDESHLLFNKEFDDMSMKKEVEKLPNLTVVISLSKFFNIPGIRMGAVISNPLIIDKFRMQNVPYYINNISSDILRKNIINKDGISHVREKLFEVKNDFYEKLKGISRLDVKQNEYNNFFMCKINDENISARKLERFLAKQGIMIRLCEGIPGEWIRLSINTIENNDILIEALNNQEILTSCKRHSI